MRNKKRITDYRPEMLPQNRKEVFWDVIKLHFWNFIVLGCIVLLFSLPLHLAAIWEDMLVGKIYAGLESNGAYQEGGYVTVLAISVLRAAVSTVLSPFFAIGLSGILRIIRQYAWGENVFLVTDFIKGLKQNWKQIMLLQFVMGVVYTLSLFAWHLSTVSTSVMFYLLQIPMWVFVLVVLPVFGYAVAGIPIYSTKLSRHLLTGLQMYGKKPLSALLGLLGAMAIYLPLLIPNLYVHIFGRIICSLLTPFVLLGWCLFCYEKQDRYINLTQYPELIGRGTFSGEKIEE